MTSTVGKNPAELEAVFRAIDRSQGIIEFSPSGIILSANENYLCTMGYALDEIVGQYHAIFMPPLEADRPEYRNFWAGLCSGGFHSGEFRRLRKDGNSVWLHGTYTPVSDAVGRPFKIVKFASDITPQVVARQTLIAVMHAVPDGVLTIDEAGAIELFNPAATRIFGYGPDEAVGQNVNLLMPQPDDGFWCRTLHPRPMPAIGAGGEVRGRRKHGEYFPVELGINEMHVVGKRMFVCTVRDITEQKIAKAAIEASIAALSRSNQELDDFAYIASHDLKEPLRGLSNNALFLKEDFGELLGEAGGRRLNRITYLCERMERLVNDLLYFSRLGRQDLAIRPTDLNQVVADITAMMESTLVEANVTVLVPERLPTIVCDATGITEVFRNLITNAVKYNDKPEKRVEIGCTASRTGRVFHVRDNGIGIAPEFYQDIFRIFKRLNNEDDLVKGTGVGLTFVKKIIERHDGKIWIESEPGVGTTFFLTIDRLQEG